jgi:hypothetical protein
MTRPTMQRLRRLFGKRSDDRGVVLIEFAYVLPFMLLVGFGGIEMASLTLVNTRISQMTLSVADNASRVASGLNLVTPQIREADINEIFLGAELQAGDLKVKDHGRIILSSLQMNTLGGQEIKWQRCFGNRAASPSSYGVEGSGANATTFPGMGKAGKEVKAVSGSAVMFVEVYYTYQPLLFGSWLGPRIVKSTAAFTVRESRDLSQVYNTSPAAPVSSC